MVLLTCFCGDCDEPFGIVTILQIIHYLLPAQGKSFPVPKSKVKFALYVSHAKTFRCPEVKHGTF